MIDDKSDLDKKTLAWWNRVKERRLSFLFRFFEGVGITADILSYISLVFTLLFVPLLFYDITWAALMLVFHLLFDNLDGGMARYTKKAGSSGVFTDSSCDLIAVAVTTAGFVWFGLAEGGIAVLYVFLYLETDVLAFMRNQLKQTAKFNLRPRLLLYFAFFGYVITLINVIDWVMLFSAVAMASFLVRDYIRVKRML
jgi:phosphatidylglycerophosphate synthase